MTSFEDREKGFERKFAHDEELRFRATARRNRLLGLWAAGRWEAGEAAQAYAREVVKADLAEAGDEDVFRKIRADFDAKGVSKSDHQIRRKMAELMGAAIGADRSRSQSVTKASCTKTGSASAAKERRTLFNAWLSLNDPFLIELIGRRAGTP